jgi:hypothetical protein
LGRIHNPGATLLFPCLRSRFAMYERAREPPVLRRAQCGEYRDRQSHQAVFPSRVDRSSRATLSVARLCRTSELAFAAFRRTSTFSACRFAINDSARSEVGVRAGPRAPAFTDSNHEKRPVLVATHYRSPVTRKGWPRS